MHSASSWTGPFALSPGCRCPTAASTVAAFTMSCSTDATYLHALFDPLICTSKSQSYVHMRLMIPDSELLSSVPVAPAATSQTGAFPPTCRPPTPTTPQQPSLRRLHWLPYVRSHPARRELTPSSATSSESLRAPNSLARPQARCGGAVFTCALMSGCKADGAQFDDTATGISGNSMLHSQLCLRS